MGSIRRSLVYHLLQTNTQPDLTSMDTSVAQLMYSFARDAKILSQDNSLYSIVYHTEHNTKERKTEVKEKGRMSFHPYPLVMCRRTPITDNVHATDHLSDSEEAQDLRGSDTSEGDLLAIGATDTGQNALGRGNVLEVGRVASGIDQGLEVGLEGGQVSGRTLESENL